jgi:sugar-phosphatase
MPSVRCAAVLLDLDGVLVDSSAVVYRHWTAWGRSRGLAPDDVMHTAHGRRPIDTLRLLAPELDETQRQREAARIVQGETTDFEGMRVLPGAVAFVDSLAEFPWTIATSGPRLVALARLRFAGISIPGTIVTAEDVALGKPAPDPYRLAAQRLATAPEQCIVLEDSPAGIRAALAAGAAVIGVRTTHSDSALRDAGAVELVDDLSALRFHRDARQGQIEW